MNHSRNIRAKSETFAKHGLAAGYGCLVNVFATERLTALPDEILITADLKKTRHILENRNAIWKKE